MSPSSPAPQSIPTEKGEQTARMRQWPSDSQMTNPSSGSSGPAAACPPWVLLYFYGEHEDDVSGSSSATDANTMAVARTTPGHPIRVSFRFAPPPEVSRLHVRFPDGARKTLPVTMAAHGDSVLFRIVFEEAHGDSYTYTADHFVYNAGTAAGPNPRLPTVYLLPPCHLSDRCFFLFSDGTDLVSQVLNDLATGLLLRGQDEFVVAELTMVLVRDGYAPNKKMKPMKKVQLLLLRHDEWTIERPTVTHVDGEVDELLSSWKTSTVLAVGDEMLCWVDVSHGLLFLNVFDESPELRYVPLPLKPYEGNVCVTVTAAGKVLKFVIIFPRCCCGGEGATKCHRSLDAYTINTWSLRMDDMTWVMDGMLDSTEIWALDAYKGLPKVQLVRPFVSVDDPHVICFAVSEYYKIKGGDWLIMFDLKSKALLSTRPRRNGDYGHGHGMNVFPSRISDFLNPNASSSCSNGSLLTNKSHVNIVAPTVKEIRANNDKISARASCNVSFNPAMQASEILMVFQQTTSYGLANDDFLKAFNILRHDNGRRFKALLDVPISLRKDWLLMEIKAGEQTGRKCR
ncbi:hypothetical protein EJB05_29181, partial [Eragrostis curvula]